MLGGSGKEVYRVLFRYGGFSELGMILSFYQREEMFR